MKAERTGFHQMQHEQLLQELVHDSYKSKHKLHQAVRCPDCGAIYLVGRWCWGVAPRQAHVERCPACHRIHDHFPAGYITLRGSFLETHRDEILNLVKRCEKTEKADHPLQRIMEIEPGSDGTVVTTTDTHLAHRIGHALHDAYKGELEYHYCKEDNLLRVMWTR